VQHAARELLHDVEWSAHSGGDVRTLTVAGLTIGSKPLAATSVILGFLRSTETGGGSKPAESPTGGAGEPTVDPTVPSWLPESCIAYHKAVVQAINCEAVEQSKRDEIKQTFDATSVSWKQEPSGEQAQIDEIAASCVTTTESVRADIGERCI
jgi:hypothetical protein